MQRCYFTLCLLAFLAPGLAFGPAAGQLAVTTFGADDAASCYANAQNELARDTAPCDDAIRDADTMRGDRMKTFVNRGIICNRNGDLRQALDDFNAALAIDATSAEAFLNRGNTYFLMGDYDQALREYQRALDLDVKKPWAAHYNIGLAYEAKTQPEEARAAYEKALALNPLFSAAKEKVETMKATVE